MSTPPLQGPSCSMASYSSPNAAVLSCDPIMFFHDVTTHFPPEALTIQEERISLGIQYLEKFGLNALAFFQRNYRLTHQEYSEILNGAREYKQDVILQYDLEETRCPEEIALIRQHHPEARFYEIEFNEENTRSLNLVAIDGKEYYFYAHAYKGPPVNAAYIARYRQHQEQEQRPAFCVLENAEMTLFLMEVKSCATPQFDNPEHLKRIIDLIVNFSLNCKGLDMLPCRLAIHEERLFCTDQKLDYGTFESPLIAFRKNIEMLKNKIQYRGFAEEENLLALVDAMAQEAVIRLLEKGIAGKHGWEVKSLFPPQLFTKDERLTIATLFLTTMGTRSFCYLASDYQFSFPEQQECKRRAGNALLSNSVSWEPVTLNSHHFDSMEKAQQAGIQGTFEQYCNRVDNYKSVLTVALGEHKYVVREVNREYIETYQCKQAREHRPDFLVFPASENSYFFLSRFIGSQTIDYLDFEHLDLIVDLSMHFSEDKHSLIDFNQGNLVVFEGKLFYIDKDLAYGSSENPRRDHLEYLFLKINETLFTPQERQIAKEYVKAIALPYLNLEDPKDLEVSQFLATSQR